MSASRTCPKPQYFNPASGKTDRPCGRAVRDGAEYCHHHDPVQQAAARAKSAATQKANRERSQTPRAFTTWTKGGVRFIAFPAGDGVSVLDEHGTWYGSWRSEESFRSGEIEPTALGTAVLDARLTSYVVKETTR